MQPIRRALVAAFGAAALGLIPVVATAQAPASLQFDPAGTRLTWQITEQGSATTSVNTIRGMDGRWATFVRGSETEPRRFVAPGCWACSGNITFDEAAYLALWPLSVGKSVTLTRQDTRNSSRRWQDVIRVVRTETVTVPAGQFQTFVIETQSRALAGNWEGTQTEWWAPSLGWVVKTLRVQNSGQRYEAVLTAHQRP